MAGGIRKWIDLLLYSNTWIALAAVAMSLQSQYLLFGKISWSPLLGFVFFATLSLYAAHRIIGLDRVKPFQDQGRYESVRHFRRHLVLYAIVSALAGASFFFLLKRSLQLSLILPCLIAAAYVLPVLGGGKRFRDLHYLKIFLLTMAWAWITVAGPAADKSWALSVPGLLMTAERAFFIFALTLPFDIRDIHLDAQVKVKTIPLQVGIRRTKLLAGACMLLMLFCCWLNFRIDVYPLRAFSALVLSAVISCLLICLAKTERHDYYFSGLLDGMLILQFVLIYLSACIFS